jgi:hypothetical protein
MPLRSALDAAGEEAKRSASEVQSTLDSAFDRLVRTLRDKVDINALLSKLFQKLRH